MLMQPTKPRFQYRQDLAFHVGVEREFFIVDQKTGLIVPRAPEVLVHLRNPFIKVGSFGYELSACQIEYQTLPGANADEICRMIDKLDAELDRILNSLGLKRISLEVAPADMPRDIYPDPSGRYEEIASNLSVMALTAALQVTGTHFHVGMPDALTALRIYNQVIKHNDELCALGDGSNGERLRLYGQVTENATPVPYESWATYDAYAMEHGFFEDTSNCWHLIRLTKHGTIEFRNFGVTESTQDVVNWAMRCQSLCLQYQ